jgi:hypothetical protein
MAMTNAERQKLWRQRHPGARRGRKEVRITGARLDLLIEEAMNKDLRQANAELDAALEAAQAKNAELRRANEELTGMLESARAELASKVVLIAKKLRPC